MSAEDPADDDLLERWRAGDKRAGNALFTRHFRSLLRFFRNKVSSGIEDLVQDTLLACVRGRDRVRDDRNFRAYMFGTARLVLVDHLRKNADGVHVDFEQASLADLGPGPSTAFAKRREERLLLEGLRRLPLEYQVTLELYYWEGLSGPELAGALGVPEATVRSRIRRGSERLREALTRLSESPDVLSSTLGDLEGWLTGLREACARDQSS
jgi:RNA polymerase sigma-70 factor (ECF subfamily)